jgi:hypothetical protein
MYYVAYKQLIDGYTKSKRFIILYYVSTDLPN